MGVVFALVAGFGVFYLFTAIGFGWRGLGFGPTIRSGALRRDRFGDFVRQAGLDGVRAREFVLVSLVFGVIGGLIVFVIFGGVLPPIAGALTGGFVPWNLAKARRTARTEKAREGWPRIIEEIRLLSMSAGQSIPQALFTVGDRAPVELRPAFADAHREWLLTTDFERTVALLKERLADPTADAALETLLIAHQLGGTDVDARLAALVEDRITDLQGRKDARSKQAGVRFARYFVLVVPLSMGAIGLTIGEGRAAYAEPGAQVVIMAAFGLMGACWLWAGRLMALPREERVLG